MFFKYVSLSDERSLELNENSKYEFVNGVLITAWSLTIARICLQLKKDDKKINKLQKLPTPMPIFHCYPYDNRQG